MTYTEPDLTTLEKMRIIRKTLSKYNFEIGVLEKKIANLDKAGICTGVAHWRENNNTPILYANHSTGESCPIHGEPKPGKRLRTYIGTSVGRQQTTLAAIKRHEQKHIAKARISAIEVTRYRIESAVIVAWRHATGKKRGE